MALPKILEPGAIEVVAVEEEILSAPVDLDEPETPVVQSLDDAFSHSIRSVLKRQRLFVGDHSPNVHRRRLTAQKGWGASVIDRLSTDLHAAFPETKGFSPRNLKYMRAFAEVWPDEEIVQQAVARLPWGHNVRLLDRLESQIGRAHV